MTVMCVTSRLCFIIYNAYRNRFIARKKPQIIRYLVKIVRNIIKSGGCI